VSALQDHRWVVAITGRPATGKSALADRLAERFDWPVLTKDGIKETLFETLGTGDRSWSRRLSEASFGLMFRLGADLVRHARVTVVEGNFRTRDDFARLSALADTGRARLLVVELHAHARVIRQRLQERAGTRDRHPGHLDDELVDEIPEKQEDVSGQATDRAQSAYWLKFDTEVLDDSVLDQIASGVVARIAP
jgi:predicted kinase